MTPVLPALAATLLLVRDRDALEVLMMQRHAHLRFAPGAHVFPGGKLEAQDLDPLWRQAARGWDGLQAEDRGLRICAIREAFEETGLLLAHDDAGQVGEAAATTANVRAEVIAGDLPFRTALQNLGLRLDLDRLTPFGRWITPQDQAIRFDAAFYIARAPDHQTAVCDGFEAISTHWTSPATALRRAEVGDLQLMAPTRASLERLGASATATSALVAARGRPDAGRRQPNAGGFIY